MSPRLCLWQLKSSPTPRLKLRSLKRVEFAASLQAENAFCNDDCRAKIVFFRRCCCFCFFFGFGFCFLLCFSFFFMANVCHTNLTPSQVWQLFAAAVGDVLLTHLHFFINSFHVKSNFKTFFIQSSAITIAIYVFQPLVCVGSWVSIKLSHVRFGFAHWKETGEGNDE